MSSQHAAPPTSEHLHAHLDGDAQHGHYIEARSQKAMAFALTLTLLFAVVEVVTGFLSNSLALISDAGHMVTDAAALGLALLAQLIASARPRAAIPSASYAPRRWLPLSTAWRCWPWLPGSSTRRYSA